VSTLYLYRDTGRLLYIVYEISRGKLILAGVRINESDMSGPIQTE
jgi:hypothetical protein